MLRLTLFLAVLGSAAVAEPCPTYYQIQDRESDLCERWEAFGETYAHTGFCAVRYPRATGHDDYLFISRLVYDECGWPLRSEYCQDPWTTTTYRQEQMREFYFPFAGL